MSSSETKQKTGKEEKNDTYVATKRLPLEQMTVWLRIDWENQKPSLNNMRKLLHHRFLFLGDFNVPNFCWKDNSEDTSSYEDFRD